MNGWGRALAPLMLAGLLAACVVPPPGGGDQGAARPSLDAVLARLPEQAAGFARGTTTDMEASQPGQGRAVDYATLADAGVAARAAIASVMVYDHGLSMTPASASAVLVEEKLNEGVRDALVPAPGRQMRESGRHTLPVGTGAPLRCAVLEGTYGRTAMWQQVCVGTAAGRFLKVFVAVPTRQKDLLGMNADAFTQVIAAAARG